MKIYVITKYMGHVDCYGEPFFEPFMVTDNFEEWNEKECVIYEANENGVLKEIKRSED